MVFQSNSGDRIEPLGVPGESTCPRCHHRLVQASMDGAKVEHCEECGGILIDSPLFALLVRDRRAAFKGVESKPMLLDPQQLRIKVDCPRCHNPLEVHPYYGPGNVVVDSCSRCRLVWLDGGEMASIEVAPGRR